MSSQTFRLLTRSVRFAAVGLVTVTATVLMPIMASASPAAAPATPTITAPDPCLAGSNSSIANAIYKIVAGTNNRRVQIAQIVTSCRLSTQNAADVTNIASQLIFGGTGNLITLQDGSMVVTPRKGGSDVPVFWISGGKVFPATADVIDNVDAKGNKDFLNPFVVANIEVDMELDD